MKNITGASIVIMPSRKDISTFIARADAFLELCDAIRRDQDERKECLK